MLLIPLVHRTRPICRFLSTTSRSLNIHQRVDPPKQPALPPPSKSSESSHSREPLSGDGPSSLEAAGFTVRATRWWDQGTNAWRERVDNFSTSAAQAFSQLGSKLNEMTGYDEIEVLKRQITEQETRINAARQAARIAKEDYDKAAIQRASSQREVNDLLQRKSSWSDDDVSRFTNLVRQDHVYEQNEARAKEAVMQNEDAVEKEFSELMRSILARYHEEQIWSDKIRSASTYGSLAALGLNLVVFIMAIIVVEPWKRRRLAQTFNTKIEEVSKQNAAMLDARMEELSTHLEQQSQLLSSVLTASVSRSAGNPPSIDGSSLLDQDSRGFKSSESLQAASTLIAGAVGWLTHGWFTR